MSTQSLSLSVATRDSRVTTAATGTETSERSDNSKRVFLRQDRQPCVTADVADIGEADTDHLASHRMGSEAFQPGTSGSANTSELEPLACVGCRSRKLKCDRTKPACTRCRTLGGECVYPEARRKPTFKRRNVKEIEARLGKHLVQSCRLQLMFKLIQMSPILLLLLLLSLFADSAVSDCSPNSPSGKLSQRSK